MFQGSVREAFGFSSLEEYKTGGCVHVIVNNQIGFTTLPKEADSAIYCRYGQSDVYGHEFIHSFMEIVVMLQKSAILRYIMLMGMTPKLY